MSLHLEQSPLAPFRLSGLRFQMIGCAMPARLSTGARDRIGCPEFSFPGNGNMPAQYPELPVMAVGEIGAATAASQLYPSPLMEKRVELGRPRTCAAMARSSPSTPFIESGLPRHLPARRTILRVGGMSRSRDPGAHPLTGKDGATAVRSRLHAPPLRRLPSRRGGNC